MATDQPSTKLAVILHADILGSTSLVQQDERLAHERIQACFRRFSNTIDKYQGRLRELRGDALLAEFERASDAVCAALVFQADQSNYIDQLEDEIKPLVRIGIAMGEVVIADNTLTGAGVVLSQRVEQLAEAGGVCITAAIHEGLPQRLPFDQQDIGEQQLKGFDERIRVYRIALTSGESIPPPQQSYQERASKKYHALSFGIIVLAITAGLLVWQNSGKSNVEPASIERMAYPLPDIPSIAVLPLDNLSEDPSQDYFADGMTEDLITDLSKNPGLFVIARNSSFSFKGQAIKIREVAEQLGVRYVLEGSVRRSGDQVRINAQLIDAVTGGHIWAERYDGSLSDVFALQDKVIVQITEALSITLTGASPGMQVIETDVPGAYDAFLQGWSHYLRHSQEDSAKAIEFFDKAVALDPNYSRAYAGLARVYWDMSNLGWEGILGIEWEDGFNRALAAIEMAMRKPTAEAYAIRAEMLALWGKPDQALIDIAQALDQLPNSANYISKAKILNILGRAEEAELTVRQALRMDPNVLPVILRTLGHSLLHQQRYLEAAEAMQRAIAQQPDHQYSYATLASIYGHLERFDDASNSIAKYNEIVAAWNYTPLTVQEIGWWWDGDMYSYDRTYLQQVLEGLRKAGVPEGAAPQTERFEFTSLVRKVDPGYLVEGVPTIDVHAAKALHGQNVTFIDVRDPGSWSRRRIPGAFNLDLNIDFDDAQLSSLVDKNDEVVIHCWTETCMWAAYACAKASRWDFKRVHYFAGGIAAWVAAGYPVENDSKE